MDVDALVPGQDFPRSLGDAVNEADVLLVIIGPSWLTITDPEGNRRLDDPNDFVYLEVEGGLSHAHVNVIPVLVEDATMPLAESLPDRLKPLATKQAAIIRHNPYFKTDMERLAATLGRYRRTPDARRIVAAVVAVGLVALLLAAFVLLNGRETPEDENATQIDQARLEASPRTPSEEAIADPTGEAAVPDEITPTPAERVEDGLARAASFSGANSDWVPFWSAIDGIDMVLVPAGCFEMGSESGYDAERPVHRVCFAEPFWIDRTEVTNLQHGSAGNFTGDHRPRDSLTWTEAAAYCESRGGRLPTEAEWEYAARGPDGWTYPWGMAFVADNAVWNADRSATVGTKPAGASWVGALDMAGNLAEWVADWYDPTYYGTLADGVTSPPGPTHGEERGVRGGYWRIDEEGSLRAAFRLGYKPTIQLTVFGFRCVRTASE
jgi:formylglycine-generating enzyme required for sulfatase activity